MPSLVVLNKRYKCALLALTDWLCYKKGVEKITFCKALRLRQPDCQLLSSFESSDVNNPAC